MLAAAAAEPKTADHTHQHQLIRVQLNIIHLAIKYNLISQFNT
jgi:hypothetical protein